MMHLIHEANWSWPPEDWPYVPAKAEKKQSLRRSAPEMLQLKQARSVETHPPKGMLEIRQRQGAMRRRSVEAWNTTSPFPGEISDLMRNCLAHRGRP
jgi:hypothetical protein